MDCLDGKDLTTTLNDAGPFATQRALLIFIQLAEAVAHAHAKGIVHRDLKPGNVIIEAHDDVEMAKIVDFGIAQVGGTDKRPTQHITQTGEILGSPLYMAPEQCIGNEQDARTDIYALGCVMYEVLTGEPPFAADNAVKTILKHIHDEPMAPSAKANGVPADLDKIILHCLEKQPGDRYQTASDLCADLQKVLENRPVHVNRPSIKIATKERRRQIIQQIAITCTASLVIAGGLFYFFNDPYANKTGQELEIEGYMRENGAGASPDYKTALNLYRRASKKGNNDGLVSEALLYEDGHGVPKDEAKAAELYRRAADLGNPRAQHNLALLYEDGHGVSKDPKEAMKWYQRAAAQNNHSSETNIGALYANGMGFPQDYVKAFEWTMKGARGGIPKAEYLIGTHYHYGLGVPKDPKKAITWYSQAIQHGQTEALSTLADVYGFEMKPPDYDQAFQNYERAADQGDKAAMVRLGQMYESGLGTKKDYKRAYEFYSKAADGNYSAAYYQLSLLYTKGRYVKQDPAQAKKWMSRFEKEDNARHHDLSVKYKSSTSADRNQTKAAEWFKGTRSGEDDPVKQ